MWWTSSPGAGLLPADSRCHDWWWLGSSWQEVSSTHTPPNQCACMQCQMCMMVQFASYGLSSWLTYGFLDSRINSTMRAARCHVYFLAQVCHC